MSSVSAWRSAWAPSCCSRFSAEAFFLRLLLAVALGFTPVVYILHVRSRRLRKFEEHAARCHRPLHPHHARRTQHPQRPRDHRHRNRRPREDGVQEADGRTGARLAGGARAARPRQARPADRSEVLHHQPDSAAPDRRQHGDRAGEPFHAGARASEHGRENEGAHRAAALFRRTVVRACPSWSAWASGF